MSKKQDEGREKARQIFNDAINVWIASGKEKKDYTAPTGLLNQVMETTGLKMRSVQGVLGAIISGTSPPPPQQGGSGEDGKNGKGGPAGREEKPPTERGHPLDRLDLKSDDANALRSILKGTLGVASPQAASVLEDLEAGKGTDSLELYASLQMMGLSNQRAQLVAYRWLAATGRTKEAKKFAEMVAGQGSTEDEGKRVDDFDKGLGQLMRVKAVNELNGPKEKPIIEQVKDLVMLRETMAATLGSKDGGGNTERAIERMMDRMDRLEEKVTNPGKGDTLKDAREMLLLKTVLKDESGTGLGGAVVETVTEYETVKDEKGKEVTDENGTILTRPARTVRRPVAISGMAQGSGGDEIDKILAQHAKMALIKSLNGMGSPFGQMGFMPGMAMVQEPIIEEGKVILDQAGQPVMRTRYEPASGGNSGAGMMQLVTAQTDGMLKVVEAMKPKGESDTSALTQVMLKRIDALSDNQINMLQKQVDAMANQDPLGWVSDTVDKLRKVGAFGDKGGQSLEATKLSLDLDKWKFEHDDQFKRWSWEQRQTVEDKKYARKQLEEFGRTIRDGITKVGAPVAQGFAKGYTEGKNGGKGAAARQESRPQEKAPIDMTDEEVVEMMTKIGTAEKTVEKAKANILVEVHRRGLNV